ncbi:MAG TPA: NAD(P)-binding domain-containing protein, partial [Glaciihabitans sp.]|nr:NAD(P)-binding domain-containing protein [Glaciihabitans sp.]
MATVAYLGLGTMGLGMVNNLLAAGHQVTVWNRSEAPTREAAAAGAHVAASVSDAVSGAEIVMYCFSDDSAIDAV